VIEGYKISSQKTDMDITVIHRYLASSYWAKDIPLATLTNAIENSLCFGVFTQAGAQVGFARVISDFATFGYLSDVFILEEHRGQGLSKWLMRELFSHPQLQGFRRFSLVTKDAHELYTRFGFSALASPEGYMEHWLPDIYQTAQLD
jgi:GNAT superfamily N-acetyltransferase